MALAYIDSGVGASANSMNLLFGELDTKLAKTFGGGKSFVLAVNEASWIQYDLPIMRLLGVPFYFFQGTGAEGAKYLNSFIQMEYPQFVPDPYIPYIDDLIGASYNEQVFIDRKSLVGPFSDGTPDFNPIDYDREIIKINDTYLNPGPFFGYRYESSSFFDKSLLKYSFSSSDLIDFNWNNLYLESPLSGAFVAQYPTRSISTPVSGLAGQTYNVDLLLEGYSENKEYVSGTSFGSPIYSGGIPGVSDANIWKFEISDPLQTFYINFKMGGANPLILGRVMTVPMKAGATATLSYDTVDGLQLNYLHWGRVTAMTLDPRNVDGLYFQEARSEFFCQPERDNDYALAEILVENVTGVNLPGENNKYGCYRVHNFNESSLSLSIGTGFSYSLDPFECRCFRKGNQGDWKTGFHYFPAFESGDPRFYTPIPVRYPVNVGFPGNETGLYSWQSTYNSYSANSLVNPSVLYDWIEAFSTDTNPQGSPNPTQYSTRERRALMFQDISTPPKDISATYSGLYDYPITDDTILGDLIHHKGLLKIARISKTDIDISGNPSVVFDELFFSGYSSIVSDFAAKDIIVSTNSADSYTLTNADPDSDVALISISTNLLKSGEYIPSIVDLPYDLETYVLDSSYFTDSHYRHVSGQELLFQIRETDTVSGEYITGYSVPRIYYQSTTLGDIKSHVGIQAVDSAGLITGLSNFYNFDFKLTPFGLTCRFDEVIPPYWNTVPLNIINNLDPYNLEPINRFGEVQSHRYTAASWTRLQTPFTVSGQYLTRKRKIHFRGHGFAWSNLKFGQSAPSELFTQDQNLEGLGSFNTLYTTPRYGRFYNLGADAVENLDYGNIDFSVNTGSVWAGDSIKLTEMISPYLRDITLNHFTGNRYEWNRFLDLKQLGSLDCIKDLEEVDFSSYYHNGTGLDNRYKFGEFNDQVYIPLLTEHYNAMAEKVNSLKYARPLSADQWYKVRISDDLSFGDQYVIPLFYYFNQGYTHDSQETEILSDNYNYNNKIPFNAYGKLQRLDMKYVWGGYDADIPVPYFNWFVENVGIAIDPIIQDIPLTSIDTGCSGYSYYAQFNSISGYDENFYIAPNYLVGASADIKNFNYTLAGGAIAGAPLSGEYLYYLPVQNVSDFFSNIGQEFYWKNTFQPLGFEVVKYYTGDYFTSPSDLFTLGNYNNTPYSQNFNTGDGIAYLGTDSTLFPIVETWLTPTSSSPTYRQNRSLEDLVTIDPTARTVQAHNRDITDHFSGSNNFFYGFVSGNDDLYSGEYLSVTYPINDAVKRFWNLKWELINSGSNQFEELLPFGATLFTNTNNQMSWPFVELKEHFKSLDQNYTFSDLEKYSSKQYLLNDGTVSPSSISSFTAISSTGWSSAHSYLEPGENSHFLMQLHEPVILL